MLQYHVNECTARKEYMDNFMPVPWSVCSMQTELYSSHYFFQEALHNITGRRTVPNVFIKGRSIGGGSETAELYQSGKLREMLQEQGIIK